MTSSENIGRLVNKTVEEAAEGLKTLVETRGGDHAIHKGIEAGLDILKESIDIDDDGSISDTVPDLISSVLDGVGELFG